MRSVGERFFDHRDGSCRIAVLIDPARTAEPDAAERAALAQAAGAGCILLGGTYVYEDAVETLVPAIRRSCSLPLILFPGASPPKCSLAPGADGFLCPVVLTTRDAWFLTGWHIEAAPLANKYGLRSIPTGYILVGDSSNRTGAVTATHSQPIAASDTGAAIVLAQAASMMGMSLVYLDAGSGAERVVPQAMVSSVRNATTLPLVVGGGIREIDAARECAKAGADWVVIGNVLELTFDIDLLRGMVAAVSETVICSK